MKDISTLVEELAIELNLNKAQTMWLSMKLEKWLGEVNE